ncbi:MAG: hypothetical protein Q9157_006504 [Trypethelium eluteriae]
MKVSELYIYPIKSLRGIALSRSEIARLGFPFDRRFMLYKVHREDTGVRYEKMQVSEFTGMCLFYTDIEYPDEKDPSGKLFVTHHEPNNGPRETIEVPLIPETRRLDVLDVDLHHSPTQAYNMGVHYNKWFSKWFGFEVIFVFLGTNRRRALFPGLTDGQSNKSWMSSITSTILPFGWGKDEEEKLSFADCAPFLVVSKTSLRNVSARLPDGEEMDITKFRPNIILEGAEEEWEEDFWGEMSIGDANLKLLHNCGRCSSINVDYNTGKPGTGESGTMLKKLMKDRRVDPGAKWSPIFGRYAYLYPDNDGQVIEVGDEAIVTKRNAERTRFGMYH